MSFNNQISTTGGQEEGLIEQVVVGEEVVVVPIEEQGGNDREDSVVSEECGDSSGTSVCGYDGDYDNEDNDTVYCDDTTGQTTGPETTPQLKFGSGVDSNNNNIINDKSYEKWIFIGSTVLSRWTDGLHYMGLIVQIDAILKKCLIEFEDCSLYWIRFEDLHKQLTVGSMMADSDILCTICRDGTSRAPNEIVICDVCNQGYHQKCHKPCIGAEILEPDIPWTCRLCVFALGTKEGGAEKAGIIGRALKHMKSCLPYELSDLEWDDSHRTNEQLKYCYCGGNGHYYSKMLQCYTCLQWFHEACIQALETPLLYGDHYYSFKCSVCSGGKEFVKKVVMEWPDMIGLVINNLVLQQQKRFFDLSSEIVVFVKNYSNVLKTSEDVTKLTESQLQDHILTQLKAHPNRFINGRECRKKAGHWALRIPFPFEEPLIFAPPFAVQTSDNSSPASSPISCTNSTMSLEPTPKPVPSSLIFGACRKSASKGPALNTYNNIININKRIQKNVRSNSFSSSTGSNSCNASTVSFSSWCSQSTTTSVAAKTSTKSKTITNKRPNSRKSITKRQKTGVKRVSKFTPLAHNSDTSDTEPIEAQTIDSLDAVIPVPKNFDGDNNPFYSDTEHIVLRNRLSSVSTNSPTSPHRPTTDFGQTKRISCKVESNSVIDEKNSAKQTSPKGSPKMECFIDSNNSRNDLNNKFNILAQRVKPNGKVEYLLEWTNN